MWDVMQSGSNRLFLYGLHFNMGAPAHSWQFASCAGSSIGEKGMIYAAKVMALYGLKLIEKPELDCTG